MTEDFAAFVASFSTWAKDKEGEITEQIRLVEQELDALHQKLYRLEGSLRAFEIVFGASIPATGTFVKMFPALAPWIVVRSKPSPRFSIADVSSRTSSSVA